MATHYDVLGVASTAAAADVRRAYVALARRHHPDRGGDPARMRAINAAWATLRDPGRRALYDDALSSWPAETSGPPAPDRGSPGNGAGDLDLDLDLEDLLRDLDDDTPLGGIVVLPRWLSLLPVGLFAASVVGVMLGVLVNLPALVGLGVVAFLLSCLLFVASPFMALLASRRHTTTHETDH